MSLAETPRRRRRKLDVASFLQPASFLALCVAGAVPVAAQSDRNEEREVEDKIPSHLPIKIKIKNPEKSKDLENDRWLADLEFEVKNTGTKPIYFLDFFISFVDVKRDSGDNIGYSFQYGRSKLVLVTTELATAEDVPIEPGATHVFKLHEDYVKGWNWYRTRVEPKPHPKKIRLYFGTLSHGDGTGYIGTTGIYKPKKRASWSGGRRAALPPPVAARPARPMCGGAARRADSFAPRGGRA